jgi:hypothetical protein
MTTRLASSAAIALGLGLASVAAMETGLWSDMPVQNGSGLELTANVPSRVAELRLVGDGSLRFLDVGQGQIAIAERTPARRPFLSVAMAQVLNATSMEVFLALAPAGARVPDALVRDHEAHLRRTGSSPAPPRDLKADVALFDVDDPGIDTFDCDSFGQNWYDAWHDAFDAVMDTAKAAHVHQFPPGLLYSFYPGGYYNNDNSITPGFNQVTYLGACNGADEPLIVDVQRRIANHTPEGTTYAWTPVDQAILGYNQKYTFHSNIPASYRGRLSADDTVEHMSFAVAYNKGLPKSAGF